jgi:hypothetical protein
MCTPTDVAQCPTTNYADVSAETVGARVVYVSSSADPTMADGSPMHPYATIAAAVSAVGDGWVLVGPGDYPEAITITATNVHIVGQCAGHVTLRPPTGSYGITAMGPSATVDLRGIAITGGSGVDIAHGANGRIRSVRVDGVLARGITVTDAGSTLDVADTVVARVMHDGMRARGIQASDGAVVTASRTYVTQVPEAGVLAWGMGTVVRFSDSTAQRNPSTPSGMSGAGMLSINGGRIEAQRSVMDSNETAGAATVGAGSTLALDDCVVRGTLEHPGNPIVPAGVVSLGGSVRATRVLAENNNTVNFAALGAGSTLDVVDSVGQGAVPNAAGQYGAGAYALMGGTLTASGVILRRNQGANASIGGATSQAAFQHSIIADTIASPLGSGNAVLVTDGAMFVADRVRVAGAYEVGVLATGMGSSVQFSNGVVVDVRASTTRSVGGDGIHVDTGADATVDSTLVADVDWVGMYADTGSSITAQHCEVLRCRAAGVGALDQGTQISLADSVVSSTASGSGLGMAGGASGDVARVLFDGSTGAGVGVAGMGATLTMHDAAIVGTRAHMTPFHTFTGGDGLAVDSQSIAIADRVLVDGAVQFGVVVYDVGTHLTAHDVIVQNVTRGMNGFGFGAVAMAGAIVDANRIAVANVAAIGIGAVASNGGIYTGSTFNATDVSVRNVASGQIRIDPTTMLPTGPTVAYGIHVGTDCALSASHFTVDSSGYGFFDTTGQLMLDTGVIAEQLDAFGAVSQACSNNCVNVQNVASTNNARSDVVVDMNLPESASLAPPAPVCPPTGCM